MTEDCAALVISGKEITLCAKTFGRMEHLFSEHITCHAFDYLESITRRDSSKGSLPWHPHLEFSGHFALVTSVTIVHYHWQELYSEM